MQLFANVIIGAVMVVFGLLFQKKPVKQINNFMGYRTSRSMLNQDTWEEANQYSAWLLFRFGLIAVALGLVCTFCLDTVGVFISELSALGLVLVCLCLTERHLKSIFDEEGNRKEIDSNNA